MQPIFKNSVLANKLEVKNVCFERQIQEKETLKHM